MGIQNIVFFNGLLEKYKAIVERRYPTGFRYNDLKQVKELCSQIEGEGASISRESAIQRHIFEISRELKELTREGEED
ncbi:unnamed protein product [Linum trigynum]|uniref:Uncharacterized protein n=1 Tax=Linum trigynum TaxID=586398 RepID=A0AAV2FNI0_9ROSI